VVANRVFTDGTKHLDNMPRFHHAVTQITGSYF
jgi:hypothetical protein